MPSTPQKQQRHWVLDTWLIEIGCISLGISSLVVILVLLLQYNNEAQPQWHGVTLNAVISVLATVARIGLVVPVAESLAQWKWMWFSKDLRPLADFELLDDASRGSRGSMMLLWETKSW
jgi:heme/copper-type cytochrome/quinol oxidase subunit 2